MVRLAKPLRWVRDWFVGLLHLGDSPGRIAMGAAVGMFVAMTPTIGFQMLIVLFLLLIIPGNRAAGLPVVWITNPATVVPIYGFNYWLGAKLLGATHGTETSQAWREVVRGVPGMEGLFSSPIRWCAETWTWLGQVWHATNDIVGPLWLGSVLTGLAAAGVTYFLMYYLVDFYRKRLKERLHLLASLKARRARKHAERLARKQNGAAGDSGDDS